MSAIPKPIHTRLAYTLKQLMHTHAVHGQQIVNLQTAVSSLNAAASAAGGTTAPPAAGSAYSEAWAQAVSTAITDLITALQNAS